MSYLTIKEVATLFGVSQKTVYRLLNKKELPGVKVGGQWRFNWQEIESWLKIKQPENQVTPSRYEAAIAPQLSPLLSTAIKAGGIFYNIAGNTTSEALKNAINAISLDTQINREELMRAIISREKLCTTAIGNGIALPHPRHPYTFKFAYSSVALCFLKNHFNFEAIDNKPVDKLFFVFSKTEKEHLQLLKTLANLLYQRNFIESLNARESRSNILQIVQQYENRRFS